MIKIKVWDMIAKQFKPEEFGVIASKFEIAVSMYCKVHRTSVKLREEGAFVLNNNTILVLSKIHKHRAWELTELPKAA